jgi:hypothetical protein
VKETPSERAARNALFRRRMEYERDVRKAGGRAEPIGYGLVLIGLAIAVFGRYVPGGGGGILPVAGLGFFFPALACFLIAIVNRRRYRRDHPFKG